MTLSIHSTNICTDCGMEIERGIIATINHAYICIKNAPNSCIDSYNRMVELENIRLKNEPERLRADKEWGKIYNKMTPSERHELMLMNFAGFPIYDQKGQLIIAMGQAGFQRIEDFKQEIKDKYK